tara:strand:- start:10 stop:882 length:873 start_codon:yes stop_codon:yes gene_type:complete
MKKLLGIVVLSLLWCNFSIADDNPCSFTWQANKVKIWATFFVENKSTSSQVAKISSATIYTKDDQKMHTEIFDPPIYVKPFSKKQFNVVNQELMWDLAAKASIGCYPITLGMYEIESKPENQKTKRKAGDPVYNSADPVALFKLFRNPVAWIVIVAIVGVAVFVTIINKRTIIIKKKTVRKSSSENIIEKVWSGNETMSKTFWLYCVVISAAVAVVFGTISALYGNWLFLIPSIYVVWANVGLWKSSNNYRDEKLKNRKPYGWATAAKVYVVLNFLTTLSQAGFILRGDF